MLRVKTALITGITGQDGAHMAAFLLEKSYRVHGMLRRSSLPNTARLQSILDHPNLHLHYADVTDAAGVIAITHAVQPQELYHFAAQTDVHVSFSTPGYTLKTNAEGTLNLLEAARTLKAPCKFYQASTSEIFGNHAGLQNEQTPFQPCSPYGIAKLCAYWLVVNYRHVHGMFACNGILFNHESPLRGERFVTRKITRAAAACARGDQTPLKLGNLDARRDWGHASDYMRGIWAMMQHHTADDYVLATGQTHSVRECVELAYAAVGHPLRWEGQGGDEVGRDAHTGDVLVTVDPALRRPVDIDALCGDASKAARILGWEPRIRFEEMIAEMLRADIEAYGL